MSGVLKTCSAMSCRASPDRRESPGVEAAVAVERGAGEPKAAITAPTTPRFFKAVRRENVGFDFMMAALVKNRD
jgi:hypothetical protein